MGVVQRQGIKNTISSYTGILLGFVSLIIIQPHFLKPEEIGLARLLFNFSLLISTLIPIGVTNITIKYFPVFKNEKNGHHGFLGFSLLILLVGFIMGAFGLLVFRDFIIAQYRSESPLFIDYYYYIFPFSFFLALTAVLNCYLIAIFKSTVTSYLENIFVRVSYIGVILLYYFGYITLPQFIGAYVVIYAFQTLLVSYYLVQVDRPSLKIDWPFFKKQGIGEIIQFGLLFSFASISALGLKTLDSVMIGKFMSLEYVGIYAIVSFIPQIIETPLNALERIATAKISQAYSESKMDELKDVFYKSVKYLSVIGALLFVGVNTNITYLLHFVGKDYQAASGVVYIISLGSLSAMLGGASNSLLVYTSKPWQGALMLLLLVVITFICNFLLIPIYGINGAAFSTAISVFLFNALKLYIAHRRFGFQPYDFNILKVLLLMIACLALNYFLPDLHSDILNILLRSFLLGGIFIVMIYLLRILPEFHHYLPWESKQ